MIHKKRNRKIKIKKLESYTHNNLIKRMADYVFKNGRLSPLNQLEYNFLRGLYMYLTRQVQKQKYKDELYLNYTKIIDKFYSLNKPNPNRAMVKIIHNQLKIILYREYTSPLTFIELNKVTHYEKMDKILDILYNWSINPEYYGYASENEFWEVMNFLRKEFDKDKNDLNYAVGKWPKKLLKRKRQGI